MNVTAAARLTGLVLGLLTFAAAAVDVRKVNDGNVVLEDVPEIPEELVDALNQYQNVRSAAFRNWTADGSGLYISTRFGEVSQLHRVDMPGGARHQLTFFDEPVGEMERQSRGNLIALAMDQGGSEFDQIYLLNPESGQIEMVSDGESRNGVLLWDESGEQLAFQSTRRNGRSNDVWVMNSADKDSARVVLEAPDNTWWGPTDFSDDGSSLLVQQYTSATNSSIHLLEVSTGESRLLVGGAQNPTRNYSVGFAPDGKGFYFITDAGGEFNVLAYRGLSEDAITSYITEDIPWDVDGGDMSEDGSRAAFTTNENGISRLYLLDPASNRYRTVSGIPNGVIGGLEFSPDGSKLAMTINTPRTPSDVFVLALEDSPLEHGALTRWTFSEVGGLDTDEFVDAELFTYPTFDQVDGKPRRIPAFILKPEGEGPHPVIVSIHGGPESQARPVFSSSYQLWIERLGAAVIRPNVRGSAGYGKSYVQLDNGFKREDSVRDIGALLDWIATQPDLDEDRVVVIGGSYGGYMTLASAVHFSDRLRAAVDVVGISNFVTFLENTQDYRRDLRRVEYGDERDPEMRAHLQKISPSNNVDEIQIPLFVAQGQNDPRVPVTEAEQIVAAVRNQGHEVWYMNALNEGHGFAKKENFDLYQQITVMFFEEHLSD